MIAGSGRGVHRQRARHFVLAAVVAVALLGCTTGEQTESTAGADSTPGSVATGRAPGVTDDTVKIGVVYPDTAPLAKIGLDYHLGDYKAVYQALADSINAGGGINGRKIDLVVTPFDPTTTTPGEAECVQLTEDEQVFLIAGLFLGDGVLCPLEAHQTAVVGGTLSPPRVARAKAPWLAWLPGSERPAQAVHMFGQQQQLSGKVAVFAVTADSQLVSDTIVPALQKEGVTPVETGLMDAPANDTTAIQASVRNIAERFKAAGADTILVVGANGASWPTVMADDPTYRPKLLFTDVAGARAFSTSAATKDTSILNGSLSAGDYGPDQARFDEPGMQDCVATLKKAGVDTPAPKDFDPANKSNQPYQAAFQACPDMAVIKAWLAKAGKDLNYGTLAAAIDGLVVRIPGDPNPLKFGPPPASSGNPTPQLYSWDEANKAFVVAKS
jgi:hypothetical protein